MAKYILTVNSGNPFKNAWNDEEKDFWVAHQEKLDTPWSISDADFEKNIRSNVSINVVDGALDISDDGVLGDSTASEDEIKNGLSTLIFTLDHFIKNNVGVPANLPQDLIDLNTLQTAVNNGTAGLTFDGDSKTAAFSWVDALYRAGNTVAPVTFV
ncbi:MAG TPA: hypothetical protein DCS66_16955 [Flavobacteriaceae bacterium]|nr:hypothetical protein [Flavobacteriaceae bacterium]